MVVMTREVTEMNEDAGEGHVALGQIVVASNRGPVEYTLDDDGKLESRRGSGGVVTALTTMAHGSEVVWIACPMTKGDRFVAKLTTGEMDAPVPACGSINTRFVDVSQEAYDRYYNVFSNPLLWYLQHYLWDLAQQPTINAAVYDAWENGYTEVNQAYAEAILGAVAGTPGRPVVMFQDYHLYLAPGFTRALVPDALLTHFIHIPWPAPRYWSMLPAVFRTPMLQSLCQNDIVGLQTFRDVDNFLYTCEYLLPDARVNYQRRTVRQGRHITYVRAYPISIDVEAVQATADSDEAAEHLKRLAPMMGEQTIVRVDRLEPTKNIIRGFQAFDTLLSRYPQLAGQVKFLAFLVPSRTELMAYQRYYDDVFALVDQINARHGHDAWKPVEVFYENNYVQAIAAMTQYDVLLVNSVMDGMNLVAKEGATVNQRDGVLVLSETAGAFEQMGRHAISVAATDVEGQVRAIYQALTMARRERRGRARRLRASVTAYELKHWAQAQFDDIATLQAGDRLTAQRRLRPVSTGLPSN